MSEIGGYFVARDERPLWQRVVAHLFPSRRIDPPEDLVGFAPSYMVTEVIIHLDWVDRLRLIASGKMAVRTQTKTDVSVAKMVSASVAYVLPPG